MHCIKAVALLKIIKTVRCPGEFLFCLKVHQAACFMHRALVQSLFHQGTHFGVKGRVVQGMAVNAALKSDGEECKHVKD